MVDARSPRRSRARCSSRCPPRSARPPTRSAPRASRRSAPRSFYARTGIIGAIMLGFGRALGETMAVTMVIGNNPQVSLSLFAPQYTMAAVIANEFTEAADDAVPVGARRNRPRAVHHHADRQLAVAAADLEHGAGRRSRQAADGRRAGRGVGRHERARRQPHAGANCCRRCLSASAPARCCIALVPLALVLFFVVSQGIQSLNLDVLHPDAEAGRRAAAAWPTRSSAR